MILILAILKFEKYTNCKAMKPLLSLLALTTVELTLLELTILTVELWRRNVETGNREAKIKPRPMHLKTDRQTSEV